MLMVYASDPDKLVAEADKLLQSAFDYGPLQDDVIYLSLSNPNISLTDTSPYNWWRFSLFPSFSSITDLSTNG